LLPRLFNRIGLPEFFEKASGETLQTRGIELEFTRMRLHFVHGLVIENVRIGHAESPDDPVLSLAEIQLQLNYRALLRRNGRLMDSFCARVISSGRSRQPMVHPRQHSDRIALPNEQHLVARPFSS